jgi:serine/threonine protein kinase
MRGEPSTNLVSLLARLQLATAADLARVASRVRRLSGDLPDFESVWVDALAQARVLTPFQAAEINAGRAGALRKGPYVILRPLSGPHYATCFAARRLEEGRRVRLYSVRRPQGDIRQTTSALKRLVEQSRPLAGTIACPIEEAGSDSEGAWAACTAHDGIAAADWMAENGRLPPQTVEHIAREMLERLAELERQGIVHGDIGAAGLLLTDSGHVALPMAGLRAAVRPAEGYGFSDLQPEAYDYLAPERIADGTPPTLASDVYACGCLWWHLLTGRAPFAGGNSLAKLRAVHAGKLVAVRHLAPEAPEALVRAISLSLARDPAQRPKTFAALVELLGPSTRVGAASLSRALHREVPRWRGARGLRTGRRRKPRRTAIAATVTMLVVLTTIGSWPLWRARVASSPTALVVTTAPQKLKELSNSLTASVPTNSPITAEVQVAPVGAGSTVTLATATSPIESKATEDLILPTGKKLRPRQLDLRAGRRVVGRDGKRPLVSVPVEGLLVTAEDVVFDGVDFVWENDPEIAAKTNRGRAIIVLQAQGIEFRGCSFSTTPAAAAVAVSWRGAPDPIAGTGAEITFTDCVLNDVAAVVDARGTGGLSLELNNSLCVDVGPIVRLNRAPSGDEAVAVTLAHTTTRGDSAVLECRYARVEDQPAKIAISAVECVLDADRKSGLVILSGSLTPERLLGSIAWNGQGSLVTPHTEMAVWRTGNRKQQQLPDEDLDVAGLVRSAVEFAGSADGPPRNSRVTRWQGPTRSADAPGAAVHALSRPSR